MTDELPERLLAVLRTATGNPRLNFAAPPEPLTGGFWAEVLAFRLTGAPAGLACDLVPRGARPEAHDRKDLAGVGRWLAANPPPAASEVICHGDLHPFNLLADPGGAATVLDWSAALLGPRAYDVAFTTVILTDPPVLVPA